MRSGKPAGRIGPKEFEGAASQEQPCRQSLLELKTKPSLQTGETQGEPAKGKVTVGITDPSQSHDQDGSSHQNREKQKTETEQQGWAEIVGNLRATRCQPSRID